MLVILFAASASAAPRLVATGSPTVGTPTSLAFTEDIGGHVLIAGCEPIELERRDDTAWVPVGGALCPRAVPATEVEGELVLTVAVPTPGTWRAVLAWGADCVAGRPFSVAACRRVDVVRSEPFEVR